VVKVRVGGTMKPESAPAEPSARVEPFLRHFGAGEMVFREGELGNEMFIIQSGQVMISRKVGGKDLELAVLEKGDFFGEMALLDEFPERSATATAVVPVEALQLKSADLDTLLRRKPDIAIRMMMKLADRLREANRQFEEAVGKRGDIASLSPASSAQGLFAWALLAHDSSGLIFPLKPGGDTTLGRHDPVSGVTPDVDLSGLDPERTVSRRHATIRAQDGTLTITESNSSTNGTFLNGQKLEPFQPHPLLHGDQVQLALVTLRVHFVLPQT
jgi:hypothetical protein